MVTASSTKIITDASLATDDLLTKASHGLSINQPIRFTALDGAIGTGLDITTVYYIVTDGFTTGVFKFSATLEGTPIDVTTLSDGSAVGLIGNAINYGNFNVIGGEDC